MGKVGEVAGIRLEHEAAEGARDRFRVEVPAADARIFEGHFPSRPLLVGVAELALVEEAASLAAGTRRALRRISQVRFRKPIEPGSRLSLVLDHEADGALCFELVEGGMLVADGRVVLDEART